MISSERGGVASFKETSSEAKTKINPALLQYMGLLSATRLIGSVSAKDVSRSDAEGGIIPKLNDFYVATNKSARTRCIDGRHDPTLNESELGPQIPGGAPGVAAAYLLGVDNDDMTRGSFYADTISMSDRLIRMDIPLGAHRDKHSENDDDKVGCGAIDNIDKILGVMANPTFANTHLENTIRLYGSDAFSNENYFHAAGKNLQILGNKEYFSDREKAVEYLETIASDSVTTLEGDHNEKLVVVNYVPETTLSSNRLAEELDVQAFGYDIWRVKQIAQDLLPRPDQVHDRQRFVMAHVMFAVATIMALTDGSLHLVLRARDNDFDLTA
jgi:hypothetical protein